MNHVSVFLSELPSGSTMQLWLGFDICMSLLRVKQILYLKFDYSLFPVNKYSNIRSIRSDCQIWQSSVKRLPELGGARWMKSKTGALT